jgi:hypothetical protein
MRLENGLKIEAYLNVFSEGDQKRITQWWSKQQADKQLLNEAHRIDVNVNLNRKSNKNSRYSGYPEIDDKTEAFFPEIIITNDELEKFKDNEVRVIIVANDLRNPDQKLIVSATTIKTDFLDRTKNFLEGDPFRLRKYEYDSSYSSYEYKYGYEFEGYVVVIKNSKGQVTHTRASKSKYLSNLKTIYKCKAGEIYGEDINVKLDASPNSYFVR